MQAFCLGAIASHEQARPEVGNPYPGTHRILKRCGLKTHMYDSGSCILEWSAYVGSSKNLTDLKDRYGSCSRIWARTVPKVVPYSDRGVCVCVCLQTLAFYAKRNPNMATRVHDDTRCSEETERLLHELFPEVWKESEISGGYYTGPSKGTSRPSNTGQKGPSNARQGAPVAGHIQGAAVHQRGLPGQKGQKGPSPAGPSTQATGQKGNARQGVPLAGSATGRQGGVPGAEGVGAPHGTASPPVGVQASVPAPWISMAESAASATPAPAMAGSEASASPSVAEGTRPTPHTLRPTP